LLLLLLLLVLLHVCAGGSASTLPILPLSRNLQYKQVIYTRRTLISQPPPPLLYPSVRPSLSLNCVLRPLQSSTDRPCSQPPHSCRTYIRIFRDIPISPAPKWGGCCCGGRLRPCLSWSRSFSWHAHTNLAFIPYNPVHKLAKGKYSASEIGRIHAARDATYISSV
jgi:hypothetical protein